MSPRRANRAARVYARRVQEQLSAQTSQIPAPVFGPAVAPQLMYQLQAAGQASSFTALSPLVIPTLAGSSTPTMAGPSASPSQASPSGPMSPSPVSGALFFTSSAFGSPAPTPPPSSSSLRHHQSLPDVFSPTPALSLPPRSRSARTVPLPPSRSRQASQSPAFAPGPPWDASRQALFNSYLARLTASQGWSLSWVENPVWLDFCDDFFPHATNPTRKVLTSRILPSEVKYFQGVAKAKCKGKEITVQCDGFTARNHHHLVSFMITVDRQVRSWQRL